MLATVPFVSPVLSEQDLVEARLALCVALSQFESGEDTAEVIRLIDEIPAARRPFHEARKIAGEYDASSNREYFLIDVLSGYEINEEADWYLDHEDYQACADRVAPLVVQIHEAIGYLAYRLEPGV